MAGFNTNTNGTISFNQPDFNTNQALTPQQVSASFANQPQTGMSPAGDVPGNTPMQNPGGMGFDADPQGNPTGPYANPNAGAGGFNNTFGTSAWSPQYQQNLGGYNPGQYATTGTANQLAQALGGNVQQTRYDQASPSGIPPQNMINFGGADSLNAGLLADRYAKYDRATADAMTRAEMAMMGPGQAPNADSQGGSMGSWSQYTAAPGGNNYLGQGANMGQFLGAGGVPQGGGGGGGLGNNAPGASLPAPQQYGNQIYNTGQTPQQVHNSLMGPQNGPFGGYLRGGSPRPQMPRLGGFGQYGAFNAANSFRNRPPAFNQGLMGQLMGMPSLLSRMNQVSGFGGQGGPFGMGGQYGSFGDPTASFRNFQNSLGPGTIANLRNAFTGFGSAGGGMNYFMGDMGNGYNGGGNYLGPRFPSQGSLYQQAPGMVTPANPANGDWWSNHMGV